MKELSIVNYKTLKKLEMKNLGRVNLITGKNNTGKSTVLEALSLFAEKGSLSWIAGLLKIRGEITDVPQEKPNPDLNLKILSCLFSDRAIDFDENSKIKITSDNESLELGLVRFIEEKVVEKDKSGSETSFLKRHFLTNGQDASNASIGFEVKHGANSRIINLGEKDLFMERRSYRFIRRQSNTYSFHLINPRGNDSFDNAFLWDQITLSDKEEWVTDALRIIEPRITRVSFVGDGTFPDIRHPIVKLRDSSTPYPLRAMGDGSNRILNITLALANSANGYLLIDEFENGLHHSVQEALWKVIFETSEKLEIQVFATSHSQDSIRSFANVLKGKEYSGSLFRLDRFEEEVRSFLFTEDEVKEATKQKIDLR